MLTREEISEKGNEIIDYLNQQKLSPLGHPCIHCGSEQADYDERHCNQCGGRLNVDKEEARIQYTKNYLESKKDDEHIYEIVAYRNPVPDESEVRREIKQEFRKLVNIAHDEDHEGRGSARFKLAMIGEFYKDYEPRDRIDCEVCKDTFDADQTQEHHISYLTDTTIDVCYSCHRRIHHEDGFFDELKPDINRSEAKQLKDSGYIEKKTGSNTEITDYN